MNLVQSEIHKKEKKEKRKRKAIQCDDRREEIRHRKEYAAAKSLQSCPTLCDPTEGSPPGSPVPGILQARTLERVAISFSSAWKWTVKVKSLSRVRLFATPWTAAHQAQSLPLFNWSIILFESESEAVQSIQLFSTPWTVAYQAPPSMRFSRQEYWSGLPFLSAGDLPNPGIEPGSPALQADALTSEPPRKPIILIRHI